MCVVHVARTVLLCLSAVILLAISGGCGVQEDRTIGFSADGSAAGFQHGEEGIFVADETAGKLERIFKPDENVLATGAPLWSPHGKRLIFTTARSASETQAPPPTIRWDDAPTGRIVLPYPITYTCWMREDASQGEPAEAAPLFEAKCDHAGYVAANLAVRWHPTEDRILYLNEAGPGRHGVFEYDITTKVSRQVFPQTAPALIFDWTPDGSRLVCVLGSESSGAAGVGAGADDGIWIGRPDAGDWWHVPDSEGFDRSDRSSLIQTLRGVRPSWTSDGNQFAFVLHATHGGSSSSQYTLRRGSVATRHLDRLLESDESVTDLFWSPDGTRLGFVRATIPPELQFLNPADNAVAGSEPLKGTSASRFAGWDKGGANLAYLAPPERPPADSESWAFLLVADPQARDVVSVTDGAGTGPGRNVFDGMRVTFPHWSPTPGKLSFWATFTPSYRSVPAIAFGGGLRPGDPAAVLDVSTGQLTWMPINAHEKIQVGHYSLLKGDAAAALRWYREAEAELPPPAPIALREFLMPAGASQNFSFFYFHCLSLLGQTTEAQTHLDRFRMTYRPIESDSETAPDDARGASEPNQLEAMRLLVRFLQDLYIAEVFLSLNHRDDGICFFENGLKSAQNNRERLGSAVVLGQFLLLTQRFEEYVVLATESIAPLIVQSWTESWAGRQPPAAGALPLPGDSLPLIAGLSLLPLYAPEFVSVISLDRLRKMVALWEPLRLAAHSDATRLGVDLFLQEAYARLGQDHDRAAAANRILQNPARREFLPNGGVAELVRSLRDLRGGVR